MTDVDGAAPPLVDDVPAADIAVGKPVVKLEFAEIPTIGCMIGVFATIAFKIAW